MAYYLLFLIVFLYIYLGGYAKFISYINLIFLYDCSTVPVKADGTLDMKFFL